MLHVGNYPGHGWATQAILNLRTRLGLTARQSKVSRGPGADPSFRRLTFFLQLLSHSLSAAFPPISSIFEVVTYQVTTIFRLQLTLPRCPASHPLRGILPFTVLANGTNYYVLRLSETGARSIRARRPVSLMFFVFPCNLHFAHWAPLFHFNSFSALLALFFRPPSASGSGPTVALL